MLQRIIANSSIEMSVYHQTEDGHVYKAKPDLYDGRIIFDLKTWDNQVAPSDFHRAWHFHCEKFGYYVSAAWYRHVLRLQGFEVSAIVHVVFEKRKPHGIRLVSLPQSCLAHGWETCEEALENLNQDPSTVFPEEFIELDAPEWLTRRYEDDE
jgi:hypothetical protein